MKNIKEGRHHDKSIPMQKRSNDDRLWWGWLEIGMYALLLFSVSLIFDISLKSQFTSPKLLWIQTLFPAIAFVWMILVWRSGLAPLPSKVLWTLLALVGWWILSTCFAIHIPTALHGMTGRYNGLWTHILWAILFVFIATGGKGRKRIERFMALIAAALFPVATYAIIQYFLFPDPSWPERRVPSTIGHPVLLASILGLSLPLVLAFMILARRKVWKFVLGIPFIIFAAAIAATKSRGPWIGAIASVVLMLGLIYFQDRIRKHVAWAAMAVLAVLVLGIALDGARGFPASKRALQFARPDAYASFMNRFAFYGAALSMVRDHPISGVGFESFGLLYPHYRPIERTTFGLNVIPTMVHNGYLQAAATTGIPGLAFYLALICAVLIPLLKTTRKSDRRGRVLGASLAASIVGYLVQDLTGWLEISLSLFFWIILGLAVSYLSSETLETRQQSEDSRLNRLQFRRIAPLVAIFSFGLFAIVFSLALRSGTIKDMKADRLITLAETGDVSLDWPLMAWCIDKALEGSDGRAEHFDRAAVLHIFRVEKEGDRAAYDRAHALLDRGQSLDPFNPYLLIHSIRLRIAGFRHEMTKNDSRNYDDIIASAILMDSNNPTVYETAALLRLTEGRAVEGLKLIDRAIMLRPDIASFFMLQGDIQRTLHNESAALNAYCHEVNLLEIGNNDWVATKNKIVASLLNSNNNNSAFEEARIVVSYAQSNSISHALLGLAYERLGNQNLARQEFDIAVKLDSNNRLALDGLQRMSTLNGIRLR
jgi:putative inorganic carbon (hco3(-)) transporter